jgi:tRNA A-37 threonylcarbamoyl transferase component Bud32/tetratricopeptide (TPR) repeat protein
MTNAEAHVGMILGDRYELLERIGRGGMATVYRARDRRHGRDVAVKVLHRALQEAVTASRFLQEIQIGARLQHPHIVALHDSGVVDGCPYYVMPYVAGESLRGRLRREGQMPLADALTVTRDLAAALVYAHDHQVIHRDVKPENILLSSGEAMLADFGIARALAGSGEQLTEKGVAIGTPSYMSPEQAAGEAVVDERSDLYSLGCVLFEMLAGEPPFSGRTAQAVMARHIHERLPSLEVVRPGIPVRLVKVVERALAKSPVDRYATVRQFLRALDAATTEGGVPPWARKTLAASIVVVVVVGAWRVVGPERPVLDRGKVVVFPFEERGLPPTSTGAGTDVALMISAALEHADPLRVLDVRDRLSETQQANPGGLRARDRLKLARERGAAHYIAGVIQAHGDSITVTLRLHDVGGDSIIAGQRATGPREGPLHHLGLDAIKRLIPALVDPGPMVDLAALRERDAAAIALFLQGERAYRRSRFPDALGFFERALEQDSALALAAVKGAQSASWSKDAQRAVALVRVARARDSLLPPRYRQFARGLEGYLTGSGDSAAMWLERATRSAPGWTEALMALGEVYYHLVPLRGGLDSLAAWAFTAALASDSGFTPALFHLTEIAVRSGDLPQARERLDRFVGQQPPPDLVTQLDLMVSCMERGPAEFDWAPAVLQNPRTALLAAKALTGSAGGLGCADAAFRSILASDSAAFHWGAFLGRYAVLAATGQYRTLGGLVDSLVNGGTLLQAMTVHILDAVAGAPVIEAARGVERFGRSRWGDSYQALKGAASRSWLAWLLGVWHVELGDAVLAGDLRDALDSIALATGSAAHRLYADALSAHLTLLKRDTTGAIMRYRALSPRAVADSLAWSLSLPLAVERLKLAQLLLVRRRYEEAEAVASVFDDPGPIVYVAFGPRSLVIRYRAASAAGRRDAARRYRERLAALGRQDLLESFD